MHVQHSRLRTAASTGTGRGMVMVPQNQTARCFAARLRHERVGTQKHCRRARCHNTNFFQWWQNLVDDGGVLQKKPGTFDPITGQPYPNGVPPASQNTNPLPNPVPQAPVAKPKDPTCPVCDGGFLWSPFNGIGICKTLAIKQGGHVCLPHSLCRFLSFYSFVWLVIGESVSERRVHEHGRQLQVRLRTRLHRYTRQVVRRYVHLGLGRNEMCWGILTAALSPPPSIFPQTLTSAALARRCVSTRTASISTAGSTASASRATTRPGSRPCAQVSQRHTETLLAAPLPFWGNIPRLTFFGICSALADIDECKGTASPCHGNATCTNTPGSFTCACKSGFTGTGLANDGVGCTGMRCCQVLVWALSCNGILRVHLRATNKRNT
jgi:hypothetical protein